VPDVGASTGGFTDCLLQAGAAYVVAVDVAYGELDWSLRTDERVTVLERTNARALSAAELPYAPDLVVADVSFISLTKVLPAVLACCAERFDALAMVKPQFEVGRDRVARRRRARGRTIVAPRWWAVASSAREGGADGPRLRLVGPAGPKGNARELRVARGGRSRRRGRRSRGGGARESSRERRAHCDRPVARAPRRRRPRRCARSSMRRRARACCCASTARRRASTACSRARAFVLDAPLSDDVELCIVLGGRRPILRALRRYAARASRSSRSTMARSASSPRSIPRTTTSSSVRRSELALAGDFEVLTLPALALETPEGPSRRSRPLDPPSRGRARRAARLRDRRRGGRRGALRRAGVGDAAGSTGYNLANGGPVLAWGVDGIRRDLHRAALAHRARARSAQATLPLGPQPVAGRSRHLARRAPGGTLGPGDAISASFLREAADLAQVPGSSFYRRMRQKFGRLASWTTIVIAGGHGQIACAWPGSSARAGTTVRSLIRNPGHEAAVHATGAEPWSPTWSTSTTSPSTSTAPTRSSSPRGRGGERPRAQAHVDLGAAVKLLDAARRTGARRYL